MSFDVEVIDQDPYVTVHYQSLAVTWDEVLEQIKKSVLPTTIKVIVKCY
jgi:hypothetical protein